MSNGSAKSKMYVRYPRRSGISVYCCRREQRRTAKESCGRLGSKVWRDLGEVVRKNPLDELSFGPLMCDDTPIRRVRDNGPCRCVVVHSARARYDLVETLKSFLVQLLKLVELQLATGSSANPQTPHPAMHSTSEPTWEFIKVEHWKLVHTRRTEDVGIRNRMQH